MDEIAACPADFSVRARIESAHGWALAGLGVAMTLGEGIGLGFLVLVGLIVALRSRALQPVAPIALAPAAGLALWAVAGAFAWIWGGYGILDLGEVGRWTGNPDGLLSSSHGAGRTMSRGEARRRINPKQLRKELDGVWFARGHVGRKNDVFSQLRWVAPRYITPKTLRVWCRRKTRR
ncbi:MAG: RtcB family protein [Myxococcota bacterium]